MNKTKNLSASICNTTLLLTLCFIASLGSWSENTQAQVYKYRTPNGKLLFTDKQVYDNSYTLLSTQSFSKNKKGANGSNNPAKFQSYIYRASKLYDVEESLIKAIIKTESDFNPKALSKAGAQGLMQLMPETARSYNVYNSYNSEQNIEAGTRHIKYLLAKYKNDLKLALAAYNAGEAAVNKYDGIPPFPETQRYVQKVFHFKNEFEMGNL